MNKGASGDIFAVLNIPRSHRSLLVRSRVRSTDFLEIMAPEICQISSASQNSKSVIPPKMSREFFPRFERLLQKFSDVCLQGFAPGHRDKILDELVERWKLESGIRKSAQSSLDLQSQGPTHTRNQQEKCFQSEKATDLGRGIKRPIPETPWPSTRSFVYSEPSLKRMKMNWDLNGDAPFKEDGTACSKPFLR